MSLSNDAVLNMLKNQFVCGFRNITGEPYAGRSGHHDPDAKAVVTTNGAGPHNLQMFFLSSDGTVLHCLPGYWSPQDLLPEIAFAQSLNRVWQNGSLSPQAKEKLFQTANLTHIRMHPKEMVQRSHLQVFDAKHEVRDKDSDFKAQPGDYRRPFRLAKNNNLKTTDQVMHERMAERPFVRYEEFDIEEFTDYGKHRYDKRENQRLADGRIPRATKK